MATAQIGASSSRRASPRASTRLSKSGCLKQQTVQVSFWHQEVVPKRVKVFQKFIDAFNVVGTADGVFIDGAHHGVALVDRDRYSLPDLSHWPVGPHGVEGALRAHLDRFVACVRRGEPPPVGL